ncbi:ATP-dependent DNA helicase RecG [Bacteroidota bacterium]
MQSELNKEIKFLTGVGPKRAELLNKELQIYTFEDLIYYFPYKYIDKSKFHKIAQIKPDFSYVQLKGEIINFEMRGEYKGKRLIAYFKDDTGEIELIWFQGLKWIQNRLKLNTQYIVFGKPTFFNRQINIVHPEVEDLLKAENQISGGLQPMYNTTEKLKEKYLNSKAIGKLMNNLLMANYSNINDTLPDYLLEKLNLIQLKDALLNIHFPKNQDLFQKAQYRLKFEELFYIQINLLKLKANRFDKFIGFKFDKVGEYFNTFYHNNLKFELTNAQKKVLKEIRKDLGSGHQMNRLLQGDVGSGKTLVALMSMLIAIDNDYQTCIMAPTEILANQHYDTLIKFLEGIDVSIQLLTGSTKQSERDKIHDELLSGKNQIIIGTHALLEDIVQFENLGLVIIDEQHRFGVAQRARLWKKNTQPPHVLVMTATPIPRTLAMTLYGDLDVSIIDEMPPGRKPIKTVHYYDSKRLPMFGFLKKQIELGRQIYIVYPLIQESEKMDYKNLEDGIESISRAFPPPKCAISVVHGKMKSEEKEISMKYFIQHKTQIMIATTVIEVGVDIPNATVMVIESAERFGLSQLHQLRGRVGRGADQSYCILMSSYKLSNDAKKRIGTMVNTNDGFEIAEADLQLRGPGDIEGTQQSGIPFDLKIANLSRDGQLLTFARDIAQKVIEEDPNLSLEKNRLLISNLQISKNTQFTWSLIS